MQDTFSGQEFNRVKEIIERRLIRIPRDAKAGFPPVLFEQHVSYAAFSTAKYFMLTFLDDRDKERVVDLNSKGYHAFPGLIADDPAGPAAFKFAKSRNILLQRINVRNLISLSLGEDSSVVLVDHSQEITTDKLGIYSYKIQLAYLIAYGKVFTRQNLYEQLEDLIAYSINQWSALDSPASR